MKGSLISKFIPWSNKAEKKEEPQSDVQNGRIEQHVKDIPAYEKYGLRKTNRNHGPYKLSQEWFALHGPRNAIYRQTFNTPPEDNLDHFRILKKDQEE